MVHGFQFSTYSGPGSILKGVGQGLRAEMCQDKIDCGPCHPRIHTQSKRGDDTETDYFNTFSDGSSAAHQTLLLMAHTTTSKARMTCYY